MIFSVIVPFLNEEKYIRRCIESLLDQDFDKGEYELIFIDNGSSDSSGKIVEEFNEVTLLREDRQNVYAARNVGLKVAKGDIIAFTDADCDVAKDWLSRIHKGMSESGAVIAMGNVSFAGGGKGALRFFQDYQNAKSEYILNMGMKDCYYGYTNNMAVRASVFKELGPFMEWPVPGDTELVQRCASSMEGCRVVYLDEMKVDHLEVTTLGVWLGKISRDGRHNILVREVRNYYVRLGISSRMQIYRYCSKKNRYTFYEKIVFICFLILGNLSFEWGWMLGKIASLLRKNKGETNT